MTRTATFARCVTQGSKEIKTSSVSTGEATTCHGSWSKGRPRKRRRGCTYAPKPNCMHHCRSLQQGSRWLHWHHLHSATWCTICRVFLYKMLLFSIRKNNSNYQTGLQFFAFLTWWKVKTPKTQTELHPVSCPSTRTTAQIVVFFLSRESMERCWKVVVDKIGWKKGRWVASALEIL